MNRLTLERQQVWIYLIAILTGLIFGGAWPSTGPYLETLLWPILAALLYATFVQVPLLHVRNAFRDRRFVFAVMIGNFVLMPSVVWGMLQWLPNDPALHLGVLLVLLVPCTDWFITFAQLGRGNTARALAVTPLNLLAQLLLLPGYLWLMLPAADLSAALRMDDMLPAALALIGIPLLIAVVTEYWIDAKTSRTLWRERLGWWPVPLLAVVVFLIAGTQVGTVRHAASVLLTVLPIFVVFLVLAALIARLLTQMMRLPMDSGRTLAFSLGTRNSFLVLPFALALPTGWEITAVIIVFQSLVELFGMVFYLWWLPDRLFKEASIGAITPTEPT